VAKQEEQRKAHEMSEREVSALKLLFAAVVVARCGLTMKFKFEEKSMDKNRKFQKVWGLCEKNSILRKKILPSKIFFA
jgi:hypothetical protein